MAAEFSCGGVVVNENRVLLVRVTSLRNKRVWTFPKGHLEPGESPRQAALREVEEETGYRCSIIRPLLRVRYGFTINHGFVHKAVQWYLMRSLSKTGKPDTAEIDEVRWVSLQKAVSMVIYPSDKKLLHIVGSIYGITVPPQAPASPPASETNGIAS